MVGRDAFIDDGLTIGDRVRIQDAALVSHGVAVEDGVGIGVQAATRIRAVPAERQTSS